MAGKKNGMKSCKKLERASRLANHNKAVRLHRIKMAREHHIKNALQSCGEAFAEKLREYYSRNPITEVGTRAGLHQSSSA